MPFLSNSNTAPQIFGLGVIMAILLTGEHPMSDVPSSQMLRRMQQNRAVDWSKRYWKAISAEAKALLGKILRANPGERPTIGSILGDKTRMEELSIMTNSPSKAWLTASRRRSHTPALRQRTKRL